MANNMFCNGVIFTPISLSDCRAYDCSAVYMFCRREWNGSVSILYIGEAEKLSNRVNTSHEHWNEALQLGMNEVHVHLLAKTRSERLSIEIYLRKNNPTPLNRQNALSQLAAILAERETNTASGILSALNPQPAQGALSRLAISEGLLGTNWR